MQGILDRVAAQAHGKFRPQTIQDFFALHLAQKLGDAPAARHYRELVDQHSEERLLAAYRRTLESNPAPPELARAFHATLGGIRGSGNGGHPYRLLAVRVERRSVAVAFFIGTQLDYVQIHHLPSARDKAGASAVGFINSMMSHLRVESAALEQVAQTSESQRVSLSAMLHVALTRHGLPVWTVDKQDLLASFGHPCPQSRREVREAVRTIWPVLATDGSILDAVALGLYVQSERLFVSQD
ncbi:MAG: hypothetical protein ABSH44_09920 [Bryobacteraceae bacterium]|jgi:hypothetical protein